MPGGWVLIVEDNAGLARTVAQVLRAVGVSAVERADSVPAALALASRPGLVAALVDVGLPGGHGNGVDLAVELRRQHPKADIVVWSGADDIALVHEAHAARFDFITKGPGVELLRDRARRWADLLASAHGRPASPEARVLEIRSQCEITDAQARALRLALELRTYSEIAAALGVTKKAIEALSTRIEQRTGKTLAQWTRLAREELHEPRPIDGPDSGVRPQLPERERTRRRRM